LKKKKLNKGGDCYGAAARFAVFDPPDDKEYTVVHGLVGGFILRGEYVPLHGHAWVEYCEHVPMPPAMQRQCPEGHPDYLEMWFCVDKANGHDGCLPREVYYNFGGVRTEETARYTVDEARKKMVQTETYGPWEEFIATVEEKELKV